MKSKPVNIFTILDYLTYSKKPYEQLTDEEKEVINPYMLHRFISMNENYVGITNLAQNFPPTEKEKIYKFYLEFIPKNKVYLKYIKSNKKNLNSKLLEILSNYFKVSSREVLDYIPLLGGSIVKEILGNYNLEKKEVKELLKGF
ncbi:hypothetical protein [Haliea sp.]|uniref:hypothetical protein n=1 Tax=Haliea sp. TaxID=1932666 RepID=UPI002580545F|nr:hypothetical protein [Haliea sp.]|tara:strand:+ start:1271 stop:1702 length:432 start_codon:yes stop_codon:yes gene_type:complete